MKHAKLKANNARPIWSRGWRGVLAAVALSVLAACGGGGGGAPSDVAAGTTVISGIVSDEAIVGATVTATSLDTGLVLGSAITGANGSYAVSTPTSAIGSGYKLSSSGGTMLGQPFVGTMSAIYRLGAKTAVSNVTLLTSILADAAKSTVEFSGTTLEKYEAVVVDAVARGLIAADHHLVDPAGEFMATLRREAATLGVNQAIARQTEALVKKQADLGGICNASLPTCTTIVSGAGERLSMTFQGGSVTAEPGVLKNCRVIARFDLATQTMEMHLENITTLGICTTTGQVKLTLGELLALQAPEACLPTDKRATSMPNCVTIGSGIVPSYFIEDGLSGHRTDKISHFTKAKIGYPKTKLSRNYGAVLNASDTPSSGSASNQWAGKTPVIFVHGYLGGAGFGGDDGTWGILPNLVLQEDPSRIVALNFQWRSDASYLTVANELAKAVNYAYLSTGEKVHIVAHSFGGVLSRVMLQNLNNDADTTNAAKLVATLTTVGTPHSGIVKGETLAVEGKTLPQGWGSWAPDSLCGQISCYQSGLDANVAQWAKDTLAGTGGAIPMRGYINARLANTAAYPFPSGLKVRVLIGQIIENGKTPIIFSTDDGLISYYGQRFVPQTGRNALLSDSPIAGATVTERILGLAMGINAFPGDPVGSIAITRYTYGPIITSPFIGYKHTSLLATLATGGTDAGVFNSEVNVPAGCGTAATCQHDTWLNLKEFLLANTLLCVAPKVLQNGQCVTPPSVSAITPSTATANVPTSFTVIGQNLPLSAVMSIAEGTCQTPSNRTATGFTVSCTSGSTAGSKVVTISTDTTGNSGTVIDASRAITVSTVPAPTATGLLTDTGISASQCYQAGSDTLVSCTSAAAIALNSQQDGMMGRDVSHPDSSDGKLGFSYSAVASYAKTECVKDNITGLTWEGKPTSGLRANTNVYTNYGDSRAGDASAYAAAVNATALCGYTDWRLPTADELQSIMDYGVAYPGPTVDISWFPNTVGNSYWSSSPYVGVANGAWSVDFNSGVVGYYFRNFNDRVRLVR